MTKISKKDAIVRDRVIRMLVKVGYKIDAQGDYMNDMGDRRYTFDTISFRSEVKDNTDPETWMVIGGARYKDVKSF